MTDEQWRAAWILCETAGDLDSQAQREYVRGATGDVEVENRVIAVFEELEMGTAYPPAPDRRIGDTVGRYTLLERIGQGGMGEVYSAEDTELRRTVALKFLPSAVGADHAAASQVISEARSASRLNHPNIVTVYELIQTQWGLAIAMELVEGQSLRKLLKMGRLSSRRVTHIGRQLASALAAAHEQGIVHRDIKPENVMVRADDFVKVLDFGLAQNIRDQAAANRTLSLPVGTVRYMSPEQKAGQAVTAASDIYSLAVVLEEAGCAKDSVLTRMRSADPLRRPTASDVELHFAKLEVPSQKRLVLLALLCLLSVLSAAVYWLRSAKEHPAVPKFEQITHYSSGYDVTAAAVSSSGDQLAYATLDGGFFVRNNRTRKVRELIGPEHLTCYQLLFPSDQHLLAIGSADGKFEAWQLTLASDTPRRLTNDMQMAAVSHDGQQIAWLNGSHRVWVRASPGAAEHLLMSVPAGTHVAALFWSVDDRHLWVHRLSSCSGSADRPDVTINPDLCDSSDLVTADRRPGHTISIGPLRFTSGFFTSSGEFLFLRQDFARDSAGFNIWSLPLNSRTGQVISTPKQISHFSNAALSNLSGTADGHTTFVVRTDTSAPIYTADWEPKPPSLRRPLRLTSEENYNYPHAWSADSQSVIFESGRNGHSEIFRQNRRRRAPELLASSERENYYPQLSPDGKWILFMSSARGTQDAGFTDLRLMRVPAEGGPITQVPIGEALDEFRCSVPGSGEICLLRTTHNGRQTYYELDPVKGKGRELGRTNFALVGMLGRWALSADGTRVAIPDNSGPGRFTEMRLDPDPSKREQLSRQVSGMDVIISGMNPGHFRGEWLAWTDPESRNAPESTLPPFSSGASQFSALYFVDSHLHAHLLQNDSLHAFGVFSPDGKHIAAIRDELTSNIWSLER